MVSQVAVSGARAAARDTRAALCFREQFWVPGFLFMVDAAAVEIALLLGFWLRRLFSVLWPTILPPIDFSTATIVEFAVAVLALPIVFAAAGLCPGYGLGRIERLQRRVSATMIFFGCLIFWDNIIQQGDWSRGIMLGAGGFAVMLAPLFEYLARRFLIHINAWGLPVLIVGTETKDSLLARCLCAEPELGFIPVGFLSHDAGMDRILIRGLPVLGDVSQASAFRDQVDAVVVTAPTVGTKTIAGLTEELPFARVIVVPELSEFPSLWVNTRDLGGILALEMRHNLLIRRNQLIKRILDYLIAVPLFIVSLPILAGAAICIKIASPGPAFFCQERDGLKGRRFRMWKLRTMHPDAEAQLEALIGNDPIACAEWQKHMKIRNDPRMIAYVGAWLRKTSIDELPQLWNVLRGEMGLIGPRPFPEYHLNMFTPDFRALRARIRPGITGLWQVVQRSEADLKVQETLDTYYIRNWSLWLDLYVLIRTPLAVLCQNGAR